MSSSVSMFRLFGRTTQCRAGGSEVKSISLPGIAPPTHGYIKRWIGPRTVPVRSGHEGEDVPERSNITDIPTCCEDGSRSARPRAAHDEPRTSFDPSDWPC